MNKHNLLKKVSLCIAGFALICPLAMNSLNNQPANARRRAKTHRVYRHHRRRYHRHVRANANTWYKRNYKRLCRRGHTRSSHNRFFDRGWNDAHYSDPDHSYNSNYGFEARLNPRYSNNANYRHGWIISRSWEENGSTFLSYRYQSFWHAINEFNRGQAYAHRHRIHHDVYTNDDGSNYERWTSSADDLS